MDLKTVPWTDVFAELDERGSARIESVLTADESRAIADLYDDDSRFRSHVVMARHGFGRGEYKYFRYPLPPLIQTLRTAAYPHLVPIANEWHERMRKEECFPSEHAAFLRACHEAGQVRPTPLLLKYAP